jgi:cysteine desulfurase family protein (TIGR01976 family)
MNEQNVSQTDTERTNQPAVLDIDFCRSHFPATGNGWIYADSAGGSYVPQSVIERATTFMGQHRNQPYPHHGPGALANEQLTNAYAGIAALINAEPDEIVIGPSTTANAYILSNALRKSMSPGDQVIVTNQDHEANIGAWRRLAEFDIEIIEWRIDPATGQLSLDDLKTLLTERTKLVCVTHVSNIVAEINPVAEIAAIAHGANARVCVDGVAYAPHALIDVKAWDVDFYFLSLYKLYGPHLGVLYGKSEALAETENQNHFFYEGHRPQSLHPTGDQYEFVASAVGILDYIDAVYAHHFGTDRNSVHERASRVFDLFGSAEDAISVKLVDYLVSKPGIRVLGPQTGERIRRMPTIAFRADDRSSQSIVASLAARNIAAAYGNFYSVRCLQGLGIEDVEDGIIRLSLLHYNSAQEVDRLIDGLEEAFE